MINGILEGPDSAEVICTLNNNTVITFDANIIAEKGLALNGTIANSDSLNIGATALTTCTLKIRDTDETYRRTDFKNAVFDIDVAVELHPRNARHGYFIVDDVDIAVFDVLDDAHASVVDHDVAVPDVPHDGTFDLGAVHAVLKSESVVVDEKENVGHLNVFGEVDAVAVLTEGDDLVVAENVVAPRQSVGAGAMPHKRPALDGHLFAAGGVERVIVVGVVQLFIDRAVDYPAPFYRNARNVAAVERTVEYGAR